MKQIIALIILSFSTMLFGFSFKQQTGQYHLELNENDMTLIRAKYSNFKPVKNSNYIVSIKAEAFQKKRPPGAIIMDFNRDKIDDLVAIISTGYLRGVLIGLISKKEGFELLEISKVPLDPKSWIDVPDATGKSVVTEKGYTASIWAISVKGQTALMYGTFMKPGIFHWYSTIESKFIEFRKFSNLRRKVAEGKRK